MPRIQQYENQVNPAGPTDVQRATSANFGGAVGAALSGVGEDIQQGTQLLYRREVQNDISNADVSVSKAREKLTQDLFDQKQKGTLDVQQFKDHVGEVMDDAGQDISTPEAQRRFNEQKASTQLEFTQHAIQAGADLAGKKTLANYKQSVDTDVGILANDPSQMPSLLAKRKQWIDDQVSSGLLPADKSDELKLEAGNTYAEGQIRGTARAAPELAQKVLDNPADPVNQLLNEQSRYRMQVEVAHYQNAKDVQTLRMQKLQEQAAAQKSQDIQSGWYDSLEKNTLSTDEINFGPDSKNVDWQDKKKFVDMLRARQEEGPVRGDGPGMANALTNIWKNPGDPGKTINTMDDLQQMYIDKQLSYSGFQKARNEFVAQSSGATAELNGFKKSSLWKEAYQKIAKPDPNGMPDPQSLHNFNMWQTDTLDKIHQGQKDGTFKSSWFNDEKDDHYLGKSIQDPSYQRSNEQILKDMNDDMQRRMAPAGAIPKSPTGEEMVPATDINGRAVFVPKSKEDAARKAGKIR